MVLLEFFIDIILPIALCPWGWLSLWQKLVPGEFPGDKCGRCIRLTALSPSCAVFKKSVSLNFLEPSGPLQSCNGTALPFYCTFPLLAWKWLSSTIAHFVTYRRTETSCEIFISKMRESEEWRTIRVFQLMYVKVTADIVVPRAAGLANASGS
jgi:hypothetical protein